VDLIADTTTFAAIGFDDLLRFTVLGIVTGAIYAVGASGLVLTYTTTGVFNFAHGAVGMVAAYAYWQLREDWGWPTPLALVVVLLLLAPLLGSLIELLMRQFHGADVGTVLVITIGLTVMLIGVIQKLFPPEVRSLDALVSNDTAITIGGVNVSWDQVTIIAVAAAVAAGLRFLLFGTRLGTGMRAVVDNPDLAGLNGARPYVIARFSWMLGSVLAALAGVLIGPAAGLEAITLTFLVVNAYAAAMVGKLKSLPLTFAGAIGLGLAQSYYDWASLELELGGVWQRVKPAIPTIFLFIFLIALPSARLSVGRLVGARTPPVPSLERSLRWGIGFVAVTALMAPLIPDDNLSDVTRGVVNGVIMLSLVVLTGYSGLVSLGQLVFVGLGAWAMAVIGGGDSILGMLGAAAVAVPIGALIALPSLRLQGLYLALSTFAFAVMSVALIFQDPHIFGDGNRLVGRLDLFGLSFAGDRMFLVLCALCFAAIGIGLLALKRSAFGRQLTAMRDSQSACATLGLDIRRQKLLVFMLSAAIAGLAGALLGGQKSTFGGIDVDAFNNLPLFLLAVVGGITTVSGALIGGAMLALLPLVQSEFPDLGGVVFLVIGASAIALGKQPSGIVGVFSEKWERWRAELFGSQPPATAAAITTGGEMDITDSGDTLPSEAAGAAR